MGECPIKIDPCWSVLEVRVLGVYSGFESSVPVSAPAPRWTQSLPCPESKNKLTYCIILLPDQKWHVMFTVCQISCQTSKLEPEPAGDLKTLLHPPGIPNPGVSPLLHNVILTNNVNTVLSSLTLPASAASCVTILLFSVWWNDTSFDTSNNGERRLYVRVRLFRMTVCKQNNSKNSAEILVKFSV